MAASLAGAQGSRRCDDGLGTVGAQSAGLGLARTVRRKVTEEVSLIKVGSRGCINIPGQFYRPQSPVDACQVRWIGDLLVAEELCPGPIGRVGQVLDWALSRGVPARRGLTRRLPKKRVAAVAVAKAELRQAAPAPNRSPAS